MRKSVLNIVVNSLDSSGFLNFDILVEDIRRQVLAPHLTIRGDHDLVDLESSGQGPKFWQFFSDFLNVWGCVHFYPVWEMGFLFNDILHIFSRVNCSKIFFSMSFQQCILNLCCPPLHHRDFSRDQILWREDEWWPQVLQPRFSSEKRFLHSCIDLWGCRSQQQLKFCPNLSASQFRTGEQHAQLQHDDQLQLRWMRRHDCHPWCRWRLCGFHRKILMMMSWHDLSKIMLGHYVWGQFLSDQSLNAFKNRSNIFILCIYSITKQKSVKTWKNTIICKWYHGVTFAI